MESHAKGELSEGGLGVGRPVIPLKKKTTISVETSMEYIFIKHVTAMGSNNIKVLLLPLPGGKPIEEGMHYAPGAPQSEMTCGVP